MSHSSAASSPAGRLGPPDPREPQHWKHPVGQHRGGIRWVKLALKQKMGCCFTWLKVQALQSGHTTIKKMSQPLPAATVLKKTKQNPACGHSGRNSPWLPPTALFPTEAVVTVESVCDALSNGGAIDLRRRRLSPLAWPWLGEQIDADRQKPDLDPLYVTSARGDLPPPPFSTHPRPTLADTSSAPWWPFFWLLWLLWRFADPSPAVPVKWGVGTFRLKPVCTLGFAQFVTWLEDLSTTASKSLVHLLFSPPFAFAFLILALLHF